MEFVLISEFRVMFKGPPSFPVSIPVPAFGDPSPRGLSLLPFVVGIVACCPGDTDDDEEDAFEGALTPE